MNTLINWLLHLYPRVWRERYEEEFRALLEESDLSFFDIWDVIRGVIDTRLAIMGELTMESKRMLQIMGVGSVLGGLLLCAAFMHPGPSGMIDGGLTICGVLLLLIVSIVLHVACRKRDLRRSNQTLLMTGACFVAGLMIFFLLRQQSNTAITVGWQGIYISATFGLWIVLNARVGWITGLLPYPVMLLGAAAGIFWGLVYAVWFFYGLNPLAADGLLLLLNTGMLWLTAQLLWVGGLALWAFLPRHYLANAAHS